MWTGGKSGDDFKGLPIGIGQQEGNTIVFHVCDNGPGIPPEKAATILHVSDGSGYGVPNVHQRVQLLFGTEYGLSYESSTFGTTASLRLPVEQAEKTG